MKTKNLSKLLLAFCSLAVLNISFAQQTVEELYPNACFGSEVLDFNQTQQFKNNAFSDVDADRSDPDVVLGPPSLDNTAGGFFSLGYGLGGFIDIGFAGIVVDGPGDDLLVVETSFSGDGCGFGDDEFANIYLSQDGITWVNYGTICRDEFIDIGSPVNPEEALPYIVAIRIENALNTMTTKTTFDGYDVEGVVSLNGCDDFPDETGCYGHEVLFYEPGPAGLLGAGTVDANRTDPEQATGEPQRNSTLNFVTLGYGGTLILGFEESAIALEDVDDLEVVETTFGNNSCASYEERALVYVSQQVVLDPSEVDVDDFTYVDEICTNGGFLDVYAATGWDYFTMVKIVDSTPEGAQFADRDGYDVDGIVALHGCAPVPDPVIDEPCEGNWRTQSQGGWGQPGNGNNAGAYRNANFDDAFPNGLVVGCEDGFTLTLTSAAAVQSFLPSGGQPSALSNNFTDPSSPSNGNGNGNGKGNGNGNGGGGNSGFGTFAGNITALALSLGFDEYDAEFSDSEFPLSGLVIQSGMFEGLTVGELFAIASDVFGGCSTEYTPQQLNSALDQINNAYVDGGEQESDFLGCPETDSGAKNQTMEKLGAQASLLTFPNPSPGLVNVTFNTAIDEMVTIELIDLSGRTLNTMFRQVANAGQKYRVEYDGGSLPNGVYITKMTTSNQILIQKVMIAR